MHPTCYRPPGMLPILETPAPVFDVVAKLAASVALSTGEPVTVLGVWGNAAVYCRNICQFTHPGSVVIIPDVALIELVSNGFDEEPTLTLRRSDGRSVVVFQVSEHGLTGAIRP